MTSLVSSSGSSSRMSSVNRFAFRGAVQAALRNSFGGLGSTPLNAPITKKAEGWGPMVGGSASKVIHLLDQILLFSSLRWTDSKMEFINQQGDRAPLAGGGMQVGDGEFKDGSAAMTAKVAARIPLGSSCERYALSS